MSRIVVCAGIAMLTACSVASTAPPDRPRAPSERPRAPAPRPGPAIQPSSYDFERAADYSARNRGLSMIVMIDGEIVFERYHNGHSASQPVHIASATKSFWGPAIAAMIEDGLVSGFDERVADTLTEWRDDPRKSRVTLRHLLTLSSGLRGENPQTDPLRQAGTGDKYEVALERPIVREPGSTFLYGPNHYYVLGEFMKRKLAGRYEDPLAYLRARILDPIGSRYADWERDPSGNPNIPNGADITARDWVKFGQFALQRGAWNGRQVVDRRLMDQLFEPSDANPGYGMTWWLNHPDGEGSTLQGKPMAPSGYPGGFFYPDGLPDLALAAGQGRNKLYVIPSLNMVVVRQAEGETLGGLEDYEFLGLLLTGSEGTAPVASAGRPSMAGGRAPRGAPAGRAPSSGADAERVFERLDRNGDGELTRSEIPNRATRLKQYFDRLDRNGDGLLSPDEIPGGAGAARTSDRGQGGRSDGGRARMAGSSGEAADGDRVMRISPPGARYIDPEFLQQEGLVTFGENDSVWVARVDPHTGDFVVPGGREWFIDSDMAPLGKTFSGPEFGLDARGWAVFYDKEERDGKFQIWRGTVENGKAVISPMTAGEQHQTGRASKDAQADSTRVMFIRGSWRSGTVAWMDEMETGREHDFGPVETGVISVSWVRGERQIVSSIRGSGGRGQIEIFDTETGTRRQVTDDEGDKTDPYGWKAPEYGGEILVLAVVDDSAIAVYRDRGGRHWDRIATLEIPPESNNRIIGSAEPFTVGGASYVSLQIKSEKARIGQFEDGEIWIFGIDDDPRERVAFRCDGGKRPVQRFDPETYVGDEAFIYYNVLTEDRVFEVWRCRTGLRPD